MSVLLRFLAKELGGNGITNLGYLQMMLGVGLIIGSIYAGTKRASVIGREMLIALMMGMGICFIFLGLIQLSGFKLLYPYLLIIMVIGGCVASASVFWQSLLQSDTPENLRGRVFGVANLLGDFTLPLAYGIFGALLEFSTTYVLMIFSVGCLVIFTLILFISQGRKASKKV